MFFSKFRKSKLIRDEAVLSPGISFKNSKSILLLSSLTINLLGLALPIMTLQVYDRILTNESIGTVKVLAFGVIILVLLEGILRLARSYVMNWTGAVYEHIFSCNSIRHMLSSDLPKSNRKSVAEQMQRIGGISKLKDFFSGQVIVSLFDLPFILIFLYIIYYLAGKLVLVPIFLLTLFALIAWQLGLSLKKTLVKKENIIESKLNLIIESLYGIHTLKSQGMENVILRKFENIQASFSKEFYILAKQNNAAANYSALFTQAMIIGIIGIGAPMAMTGKLTLGTLIACVLLSGRVMQPVQRALSVWSKFQDFQISYTNFNSIFDAPYIERDKNFQNNDRMGILEIKDLVFRCGKTKKILFNKLNISLKRGDCISIAGTQGSGKTVLLKMISGVYLPEQGKILVNNHDATKYSSDELSKHIGYLDMKGVIFKGTIRDNLNAFKDEETKNLDEVVKLLGIDKEIAKLPLGYETPLDGGINDSISDGLKQRLAIARVLIPKPRIILFDNADRGLDKDGYNQLYRLLARLRGKITMIIVSDDRNILRLARHEYVLFNGVLEERQFLDDSKMNYILPYQELKL